MTFDYRTITFCGPTSQTVRLANGFITPRSPCREIKNDPTTPTPQRLHAWHDIGLGCFLFARRY